MDTNVILGGVWFPLALLLSIVVTAYLAVSAYRKKPRGMKLVTVLACSVAFGVIFMTVSHFAQRDAQRFANTMSDADYLSTRCAEVTKEACSPALIRFHSAMLTTEAEASSYVGAVSFWLAIYFSLLSIALLAWAALKPMRARKAVNACK